MEDVEDAADSGSLAVGEEVEERGGGEWCRRHNYGEGRRVGSARAGGPLNGLVLL